MGNEALTEGTLVSEAQAMDLTRPVLDEEIRATLSDIGDENPLGRMGSLHVSLK